MLWERPDLFSMSEFKNEKETLPCLRQTGESSFSFLNRAQQTGADCKKGLLETDDRPRRSKMCSKMCWPRRSKMYSKMYWRSAPAVVLGCQHGLEVD